MKLEVVYGYEKEIQPGVQARGGEDGQGPGGCVEAGGSGFRSQREHAAALDTRIERRPARRVSRVGQYEA